jgi:trans-2,3-dihydro-3-hydroxyanthranilate isomerase
MMPVRDLATIACARPNLAEWEAAFGTSGPRGAFLFCKETAEKERAFHARMFAPYMGIPEDPATGSAIAAFAGLLAKYGDYSDGDHVLTIEQGFEMGRPSLIDLTLRIQQGRLGSAAIAGQAVVIAEGTIEA